MRNKREEAFEDFPGASASCQPRPALNRSHEQRREFPGAPFSHKHPHAAFRLDIAHHTLHIATFHITRTHIRHTHHTLHTSHITHYTVRPCSVTETTSCCNATQASPKDTCPSMKSEPARTRSRTRTSRFVQPPQISGDGSVLLFESAGVPCLGAAQPVDAYTHARAHTPTHTHTHTQTDTHPPPSTHPHHTPKVEHNMDLFNQNFLSACVFKIAATDGYEAPGQPVRPNPKSNSCPEHTPHLPVPRMATRCQGALILASHLLFRACACTHTHSHPHTYTHNLSSLSSSFFVRLRYCLAIPFGCR